jgi:hypothetical protein
METFLIAQTLTGLGISIGQRNYAVFQVLDPTGDHTVIAS